MSIRQMSIGYIAHFITNKNKRVESRGFVVKSRHIVSCAADLSLCLADFWLGEAIFLRGCRWGGEECLRRALSSGVLIITIYVWLCCGRRVYGDNMVGRICLKAGYVCHAGRTPCCDGLKRRNCVGDSVMLYCAQHYFWLFQIVLRETIENI